MNVKSISAMGQMFSQRPSEVVQLQTVLESFSLLTFHGTHK